MAISNNPTIPVTERRQLVRRESDRDLLARIQAGAAEGDEAGQREQRHKRRRAIRHHCTVHIALLLGHQVQGADTWTLSEHPVKGRILDLSAYGCSLFTREQLDAGQQLGVQIVFDQRPAIRARAAVRWTKTIPERGGFASGVEFIALPPEEGRKIRRFLEELDQTIGL